MNNNYAFADFFKNTLDFNQVFSSQRRNFETASEVNQVIVEGAQAASRVQADAVRSNVETLLKTSKDIVSSGSPEASLAKQADLAKSLFENALVNMREITEMVTKCGFEAFEVLNKRASESMNEISKASQGAANKKK